MYGNDQQKTMDYVQRNGVKNKCACFMFLSLWCVNNFKYIEK